jgi:hypothetical protein
MNIPSSIKAYKAKWKHYTSNLKICTPEPKKAGGTLGRSPKKSKPRGGERKESRVRKFNEIICL